MSWMAIARRTLVLRDVPENYVQVVSAIGKSAPKNLLILPIDNDGEVNGVVELVVDRNGLPRNIRVSEKFGKGLDEKVLATVAQYRFRPGTRHGQPVPVRINIQFTLRLDQK